MFGRKKEEKRDSNSSNTLTDDNDHDAHYQPSQSQIKRATRTRKTWTLLTSLLLLISLVFTILVEVGGTYVDPVLTDIYFIKLDLSNIIPVSVPNATLINSIAQTLGLHDFYTVGLWGYCAGYIGEGVTECSDPETLYWFNPVAIIKSELLAGATVALPAQVTEILSLIRTVSHWMFALYLTGACLTTIMIFLVPLSVYSRWASLPVTIMTFITALFTTVATVIATVLFTIARDAVTSAPQVNIGATLGVEMFAFMWIAAASAVLAFIIQLGMCCCCASRRDVKTGRKRGSKKAWRETGGWNPGMGEKGTSRSPGRFDNDSE